MLELIQSDLNRCAEIGPGLYVAHFGPTVIHPEAVIGPNLTLLQGVTIGAHRTGVPHIGNDVSIATGARVIGGITIGDHVTVGAGAVVVKDVAANCVVAGFPAKPIHLAQEIRAVLDDIATY